MLRLLHEGYLLEQNVSRCFAQPFSWHCKHTAEAVFDVECSCVVKFAGKVACEGDGKPKMRNVIICNVSMCALMVNHAELPLAYVNQIAEMEVSVNECVTANAQGFRETGNLGEKLTNHRWSRCGSDEAIDPSRDSRKRWLRRQVAEMRHVNDGYGSLQRLRVQTGSRGHSFGATVAATSLAAVGAYRNNAAVGRFCGECP